MVFHEAVEGIVRECQTVRVCMAPLHKGVHTVDPVSMENGIRHGQKRITGAGCDAPVRETDQLQGVLEAGKRKPFDEDRIGRIGGDHCVYIPGDRVQCPVHHVNTTVRYPDVPVDDPGVFGNDDIRSLELGDQVIPQSILFSEGAQTDIIGRDLDGNNMVEERSLSSDSLNCSSELTFFCV